MDCVYCKETIDGDESFVVDKYENKYHIACYLERIGIYLDMVDKDNLESNKYE